MATQRMKSADEQANTGNALEDPSHHDGGKLLPEFTPEPQSAGKRKGSDDDDDQPWVEEYATDDSKWIHRDKLAKIESQELQAAGLVIPRTRAPSKQRRDRSRSNMRPGTEASDYGQSRSRKNSSSVDHRPPEISVPSWDLRTPEEIAEAEANTYFTSNGLKGGSKIPVAKTSPLPIGAGYLGGGTTGRKNSESPEDDSSMSMKRRSRSASASLRGFEKPNLNSTGPRRSGTDSSPKKSAGRKTSGGMKTNANARPKTRSGSGSGTRPSTRSGESPPTKQPEGDPPWMVNSYKPDPRLPPDQQMLPTVARRLQQEKWEKEGTYGDVYDKDFRPLNDKALLKPPEMVQGGDHNDEHGADGDHLQPSEWPLKQGESAPRSPRVRQGSYSTMPKISDKTPATPTSANFQIPPSPQPHGQTHTHVSSQPKRVPEEKDEDAKKGGCGCCVVM